MARIRTIKPDFPQSESMGRVSRDARLTFILLFTASDDYGRLRGNSRMLASLLFPYDEDSRGFIEDWLSELEKEGCIIRYSVDGLSYIQIVKWSQHQRVDKPTDSRIPELHAENIDDSRGFARIREEGKNDLGRIGKEGIGKEGIGKEGGKVSLDELSLEHMQDFISQQATRGISVQVNQMMIEKFKAHYRSYGGKDANGRVVFDWVEKLKGWILNDRAESLKNPQKNSLQDKPKNPNVVNKQFELAQQHMRDQGIMQ